MLRNYNIRPKRAIIQVMRLRNHICHYCRTMCTKLHHSVLVVVLFITLASGYELKERSLCPVLGSEAFTTTLRLPEGCRREDCDYFVGIGPEEKDHNLLHFVLEGKAKGWVAIGFSPTPNMYSADVLGCRRTTRDYVTAIDTWNSNSVKVNVLREPQDDLCKYNAVYNSGKLHCTFSRAIEGSSKEYDFDLNDYFYLLYGTGDTPARYPFDELSYHEETPLVTRDKINPVTGQVKLLFVPMSPVSSLKPKPANKMNLDARTQSKYCTTSSSNTTSFRLTQRFPKGCIQSKCDFFLGISDNSKDSSMLDFTLEGKAKGWIAIGFSETANMLSADVLGCTVYGDGHLAAIDTWNPTTTKTNDLDVDQSDICQRMVQMKDGRIQCRFSRTITGASNGQDLKLNNKYYLQYGAGETPQQSLTGGFTFHEKTPKISTVLINPAEDSDLSLALAMIETTSTCPSYSESTSPQYRLSLGLPEGCGESTTTKCEVFLGINTNSNDDSFIDFTLKGKAKGWVAVGFSKSANMLTSDVFGCNVYSDGSAAAIDTWNPSSAKTNILDNTQDGFCQHLVVIDDETLSCKFSRKIKGTSDGQDLDLKSKYYVMIGIGDTPQESKKGGFTFHEQTPTILTALINPVEDSSLNTELVMINNDASCPTYSESTPPQYRLSLGLPEGCGESTTTKCEVFLGINTNSNDDSFIDFTLKGKAKGWVAVGFSKTANMLTSDVFGCNVYSDGSAAAIDTWNPSSAKTNILDNTQDGFCQHLVVINDGTLSCKFSRKIKGTSDGQDLDLKSKYYVMIGIGDTPQESKKGGFTFHEQTPTILTALINPVGDSSLNTELVMINNDASCPTYSESTSPEYRLSLGLPEGCGESTTTKCDVFLGIKTNSNDDSFIDFTLKGKAKGWVAVGFSKTANMLTSDVFGCNVYSDGSAAAIDTWNPSSAKTNILDNTQDGFCQHSVIIDDGTLSCKFSRKIKGTSDGQDLDLESKYYVMIGIGDTPQESKKGGFTFHEQTPTILTTLINPIDDSNLGIERSMIENDASCPTYSENNYPEYRLSLGLPEGCEKSTDTKCEVFLGINSNSDDDSFIDFSLEGKAKGWVAVGFSKTADMLTSDVYGCNVYSDGSAAAIDTWNPSSAKTNILDNTQDGFCQHLVVINDGTLSCKFSRKIKGTSDGQDLDLKSKYYVMIGIGNTPQESKKGGFTFHEQTPTIFTALVNPVEDSDLAMDLAKIETATTCPSYSESDSSLYRLSLGLPEGCGESTTTKCEVFLEMNTNSNDNSFIDFTLKGKAKGWVAVGFSKTADMLSSDVFGCNVYSDGSLAAIDTWNPSSSKTNVLDKTQNGFCQHSIKFEDGTLSCKFSRKIKGTSDGQDLDLNSKYYVMIGIGDTPQGSKTGGFTFHETTPTIFTTQVNPSDDKDTAVQVVQVESSQVCPSENSMKYRIIVGYPEGCVTSSTKCEYFLGINTNSKDSSLLDFALEGKASGWVAVGFSKTPNMLTSDVLGCNVYSDGSVSAIDTWCPSSRKTNTLDSDQADIGQYTAQTKDGYICCTFSRSIKGASAEQDLDLNSAYYLLFGSGNTPQGSKSSGGFTFHETTPKISNKQVNPVQGSTLTLQNAIKIQSNKEDCLTISSNASNYRIAVGFPTGCGQSSSKCDYFLGINTNSKSSSSLDMTLVGKASGWVAVGFSKTPNMLTSDVLGCNVYSDGSVAAIDTWCPSSRKTNTLDSDQTDMTQLSAQTSNGYICCSFSRTLTGTSNKQDLDLNSEYYLLFGSGNTPQNSKDYGGFTFHETTPTISSEQLNPVTDKSVTAKLAIAESSETSSCLSLTSNSSEYRLSVGFPKGCGQSNSKCDYFLGINTNSKDSTLLDVTLVGKANGWVAVGFSQTPDMLTSDVLGCNVYSDGSVAGIDTWCPSSRKTNTLDSDQADMTQSTAQTNDGYICCKFSRSIKGASTLQDLNLNSKYYLLFGYGNTPQGYKSGGGFTFHETTPTISDKLINPVKDKTSSLKQAAVEASGQCLSLTSNSSKYRLTVGFPKGCGQQSKCDYFLGINTNSKNTDLLDLTLVGKASGWVAVGLSKTADMLTSDVLGCNVYSDGSVAAIDTWCPSSRKTNMLDSDQADITQISAQVDNEYLCCKFSRSMEGSSTQQDLDLNSKYYLLFGSGNTPQAFKGQGGFTFHETTPKISDVQINPAEDNKLSLELASMQIAESCPSFSDDKAKYRLSTGIPEGCELSSGTCDYFLGINTNSKNSKFLDFTLQGKANAWIAVGFSKTRSMAESDVYGCLVYANGSVKVIDTWNPKSKLINVLDEPQTDVCSNAAEYDGEKITCKFSRAIKGDTPGRDLDLNDDYYLMFGVGETAQTSSTGGFNYHQNTPTLSKQTLNVVTNGTIVLATSTKRISSASATALIKTHGIFMIIAWPILAAIAIYFPAFLKPVLCKRGEWFQLHRALMLSSMTIGTIAFILIFIGKINATPPGLAYIQDPVVLAHFIIGIIVTTIPFINALISLLRCKPSDRYRWVYNIVHGKLIGYIAIDLALINIAIGIYIYWSSTSQAFSLFLIASLVGILMYLTLHIIYNILPMFYKEEPEARESAPSTEEKAVVDCKTMKNEAYRSNLGILVLVHVSLALMNISVCVFIAIS